MALKEVAIATRASRSGNTLEGDIVVVRNPVGEIGAKERANYLWLLIDESELPPAGSWNKDGLTRANISLESLKARHPSLDLDLARSEEDYQPFTNPRRTTGKFQASVPVSGVRVDHRDASNSPLQQQALINRIQSR